MTGFSKRATPKKKQWETWTMADGTLITVDQMTEEHAKNVLNLLLKRNKRIEGNLELLKGMNKEFRDIMNNHSDWDVMNWMK
jgi:hypothetical protein